jgi:hypothetical protein
MPRSSALKTATLKWFDSIILGQKLCPFAPPVRHPPKLSICISNATTDDAVIHHVTQEAKLIVNGISSTYMSSAPLNGNGMHPETSLVVIDPDLHPSLFCFRTFVQLSWRIQSECILHSKFQDLLQIVLFHPQAVHDTYAQTNIEGEEAEDVANYTIRSPFPTIHLLRQDQVMSAVQGTYKDLEGLPARNKAKLRKEGIDVWKARLEGCYEE